MVKLPRTYTLNLDGRLLPLRKPSVMAIINVTPDSFYADSRATDEATLRKNVQTAVAGAADIIDVGACSTRPGSTAVSADEELQRLLWALPIVRAEAPQLPLSLDTFRADIAQRCVQEFGAMVINDVSGGNETMFQTVAQLRVPYVLTHNPATTSDATDISAEVLEWLARRIDELLLMGVSDVIADVGFGFGKTLAQNYSLAAALPAFQALDAPLLVGVSRKRMVYEALQCTPDEALVGTTTLQTLLMAAGADILRVHDVRAATQARTIFQNVNAQPSDCEQ